MHTLKNHITQSDIAREWHRELVLYTRTDVGAAEGPSDDPPGAGRQFRASAEPE